MFILRFVFLFYSPEGQFCETHLTKNMEICIISSWNANTLWVFMCTVAVYTNKGVLKLVAAVISCLFLSFFLCILKPTFCVIVVNTDHTFGGMCKMWIHIYIVIHTCKNESLSDDWFPCLSVSFYIFYLFFCKPVCYLLNNTTVQVRSEGSETGFVSQ